MNTVIRNRICLLVFICLGFSGMAAADDGEAFRKIYEKEWAFRLDEFPMLATHVGQKDQAGRLGGVSDSDQARRYAYWKEDR